jgi:hypothetical protein
MRSLPIPAIQEEGLLFLWVTARAMELGRDLLAYWGYRRVDEIVWCKTNQLGRLIRTGRTGHWLKCVVPRSPKVVGRRADTFDPGLDSHTCEVSTSSDGLRWTTLIDTPSLCSTYSCVSSSFS